MKARTIFVLTLAVAFVAGVCGSALGADSATPAAPAAKPAPSTATTNPSATGAKDAAKPAKPAEQLTKCTVKGKVATKTVMNKKTGKERTVFTIAVTEAKGEDGKALDNLKGKTLAITGQKQPAMDKFVGKDVEIKGEAGARRIKAESIK